MSSLPASPGKQVFTVVLTGAVLVAALAGLVVAIMNIRKSNIDCTIRSLSWAYVIFFVIAILSMFGVGGALFKGTELAATSGLTILTFSSFVLFVIAAVLVFQAGKINDKSLRNANYWVFGIFAVLSIINTGYLYTQRRNLVKTQPGAEALNYVRSRLGSGLMTPRPGQNMV